MRWDVDGEGEDKEGQLRVGPGERLIVGLPVGADVSPSIEADSKISAAPFKAEDANVKQRLPMLLLRV